MPRPSATTLQPEMTDVELAALREWLAGARLAGRHLEIGTAAGGTLCFMMGCYPAGQRPPFAVVDTMSYFADQLGTVRRNLANHGLAGDAVDFRIMRSEAAFQAAEAAGERFAFILIDASHKVRHVMADLCWLRLLEVGGLACFHDYGVAFKGVTWPVDRLLRRHPHFARVGQADSLLAIRRTGESPRREVDWADRLWALAWSPLLQWELSLRKRAARKN